MVEYFKSFLQQHVLLNLVFLFVVVLCLPIVIFSIQQPHDYRQEASSCPFLGDGKTYSQGNQCFSSTGLGFNTSGGKYTCGPVRCPGDTKSNLPQGNTCTYTQSGKCFVGYGGNGLNPSSKEGGCKYNQSAPTAQNCPSMYQVIAKVTDGSNNPLSGVSIDVYDNGHGDYTITTGADGTAKINSWSGDHVIFTPTSTNYTYDKTNISLTTNTTSSCGTQLGIPAGTGNTTKPCTFIATGNSISPSPNPSTSPNPSPSVTLSPSPQVTPTDTPTDTPFPSPSGTLSPTDTPIPSPTDFASPTDTPTATLTQTPTPTLGATTGSIALHFQGIDQQNNTHPNHPQRQINLYFYTSNTFSGQANYTLPLLVTFSSTNQNGLFTNSSFDLSAIPPGIYYVLAKSPEGSLREVLNATQQVTIIAGQNNALEPINTQNNTFTTLRMGDLDGDNAVTLTDYNILVDCYGEKSTSPACKSHNISDQTKGLFSDLNDDGETNGIDYNILLRNFGSLGY